MSYFRNLHFAPGPTPTDDQIKKAVVDSLPGSFDDVSNLETSIKSRASWENEKTLADVRRKKRSSRKGRDETFAARDKACAVLDKVLTVQAYFDETILEHEV